MTRHHFDENKGLVSGESRAAKRLGRKKITTIGGHDLPLNRNGTVTLFHGTTMEGAAGILKSNKIISGGEPSVYFSRTHPASQTGYGTHTIMVDIKPHHLRLDDEFPNGRLDFAADKKSLDVHNPRLWTAYSI